LLISNEKLTLSHTHRHTNDNSSINVLMSWHGHKGETVLYKHTHRHTHTNSSRLVFEHRTDILHFTSLRSKDVGVQELFLGNKTLPRKHSVTLSKCPSGDDPVYIQ